MSTVAFTMVIVPRVPAGVFGDKVEQAGHAAPPMSFGKSDAHEPFGCLGNDRRDAPGGRLQRAVRRAEPALEPADGREAPVPDLDVDVRAAVDGRQDAALDRLRMVPSAAASAESSSLVIE